MYTTYINLIVLVKCLVWRLQKGDIYLHLDRTPPRCVLDGSVSQPTQWNEENVAHLFSTHLGGHAHLWCQKTQIFKIGLQGLITLAPGGVICHLLTHACVLLDLHFYPASYGPVDRWSEGSIRHQRSRVGRIWQQGQLREQSNALFYTTAL